MPRSKKAKWPGEVDSGDLRKSLWADTLKPTLISEKGILKGVDISGDFIEESGTLIADDLDRMASYWKSREKEIGGGWLITDDVRDDLIARAAKGEDITKYFEKPRDEITPESGYFIPAEYAEELTKGKTLLGKPITIKEFSKEFYGRSAIEIGYEYDDGLIGLNPEEPNLKFRLDRLMSNSEWVGYHYLAGNWDAWAAYLGDGYWVTSFKFYRSDTYIRPWYVLFWHDHDGVFTWLHTEISNGAVIYSDDTEHMHWDEEFAIARKVERWAQSFARRFADGELTEEWTGHDD